MTWYYVPSESLASVPAQEVSTSECMTLWADALAQSYTWNTKSLPAKSWLRVLRTVPWMTRRFGVTFTPSMLADGAARWMESLEAIPASRFPLLGSGSESMTRGTSGRQSRESSLSASQVGASSKMWLDTFGSDTGTLFAQTSNALATGSRKASLRRRKSGPPTSGNGSSSWPTARAQQAGSLNQSPSGGPPQDLGVTARNWPTPVANDDNKTPEGHLAKKPGRTVVTSLNIVATQMWPTPRSEDSESAGNHPGATDSLTGATSLWSTPHAHNSQGSPGAGLTANDGRQRDLVREAKHWQTPASDSFRSRGGERKDEMGLDQQARSHLAPETPPHGSESSQSTPTSRPPSASTKNGNSTSDSRLLQRRLNPRFTEWLMGWPPGWTSLAPLGSGSPVTASYPPRPHSPSAPSGDNWPTPDTQNARTGSMRAEAKGKHAMSLHHVVEEWQGPAGAEWMHTVGFGNLEDVAE